ncbi:MAG TPA: cupin domain-containing protein [Opitutaceae bacterium]|nr:cupin domain-containing protein [Opitutaceae bacterium]
MKTTLLVSLLALGLTAPLFAADAPPKEVALFDHAMVDATFAKGGSLLANGKYKVQAGRRDADGQVEIHQHDTDIFYITHGSATITTGGTAVDPKKVAPGEFRADRSEGGTVRHLAKGDVIVIPAGVPHWITKPSGPFLYFVVKVTTN